jgi:hypothetical protein
MNDTEKAKELFFKYDGSTFYMSRDGVEKEFYSYDIPDSLQKDWLTELREQKLSKLNERGNWTIIHFLNHHRQKGYLDKLISGKPLGEFWERCAYLEELIEYTTDTQKPDKFLSDKTLKYFNDCIIEIERVAKSDNSKQRIKALQDKAKELTQRHQFQ